jgi:hypothetical protein
MTAAGIGDVKRRATAAEASSACHGTAEKKGKK